MVNHEELAICRRRGHSGLVGSLSNQKWRQCTACGMWVRQVWHWEEQETEPPEEEIDPGVATDRKLEKLQKLLHKRGTRGVSDDDSVNDPI